MLGHVRFALTCISIVLFLGIDVYWPCRSLLRAHRYGNGSHLFIEVFDTTRGEKKEIIG